ncbi:MAG: alkyl sulfatase dimerization domain-containing protein [Sphingobium sp.]
MSICKDDRSMIQRLTRTILPVGAMLCGWNVAAAQVDIAKPGVNPELASYQAHLDKVSGLNRTGQKTYTAVGFGGNINFIRGKGGVILINTGSSTALSAQALALFRKVSQDPIVAVIYTHGYSDHTGGIRAFVPEGREASVDIYANASWKGLATQTRSPMQEEIVLRASAQLGWYLPYGAEGAIGDALSRYSDRKLAGVGYLPPTREIHAPTSVEIAGVTLQLIPAPHDTDDGLIVWMPDEKILFAGDVLMPGRELPALQTPRFEPRRDPQLWVDTMGLAASFDAEHLVRAYSETIDGHNNVRQELLWQQRIGQYLIDHIYREILEGRPADRIAAEFTLPDALLEGRPYKEYYHRLSWIVRSIVSRHFGWYSGDVLDLVRLSPTDRAGRMADAMGGIDAVLRRAGEAYADGDYRWALELATTMLTIRPDDVTSRDIRVQSLRALAFASVSANERNYLLTAVALETGKLDRTALLRAFRGKAPSDVALQRPPIQLINALGPRIRPVAPGAAAQPLSVRFTITDRQAQEDITIQSGVMLRGLLPGKAQPDLVLTLSYDSLIRGIEGMTSFDELKQAGKIESHGDLRDWNRFVSAFDF